MTKELINAERLARALDAVHEIARAVLVPAPPEELARTIFGMLRKHLTFDAGYLDRYNTDTDQMMTLFQVDEGAEYTPFQVWDYHKSLTTNWIVEHHQSVLYHDLHIDMPRRFNQPPNNTFGNEEKHSRAWMAVPLLLGDRLVGVINVQSYQRGIYGPAELQMFELLAGPIAVALENADLLALLEEQASSLRVPIIQLAGDVLVTPLVDLPNLDRWEALTDELLTALQQYASEGVVLDASGLTRFDPQLLHALTRLTSAVALMGGRCVLVGLRPQLIEALVRERVEIGDLATARDLPAGLALLRHTLG